jgi:hypothetical protein
MSFLADEQSFKIDRGVHLNALDGFRMQLDFVDSLRLTHTDILLAPHDKLKL